MTEDRRHKIGLIAEGVGVTRGGRLVIAGASLEMRAGDLALLRGPNGAGKTSLLRALAGLLPLAAGRARLIGSEIEQPDAAESRRRVAIYAGHADGVKAAMTGKEHLAFWQALYLAPKTRLDAAVAALEIASFLAPRAGALSAGQRRRLGLARLIISGKPLWLLDEPTAALDAASSGRILDLLQAHAAAGGAALIATHDRLPLGNARSFAIETAAAA